MIINIICIQHLDFTAQNGDKINGYQAWYLDPEVRTENLIGTLPRKRWFTPEQVQQFGLTSTGNYEVEVNLNGRISSLKKVR